MPGVGFEPALANLEDVYFTSIGDGGRAGAADDERNIASVA
jgi:hypothetical protein